MMDNRSKHMNVSHMMKKWVARAVAPLAFCTVLGGQLALADTIPGDIRDITSTASGHRVLDVSGRTTECPDRQEVPAPGGGCALQDARAPTATRTGTHTQAPTLRRDPSRHTRRQFRVGQPAQD